MAEPIPQHSTKHSRLDDAQGLAFGSFMAAIGMTILTHLGFVTGQTAGLAVLIAYATGWQFGWVFFAVNLPFYWFGYKRLGLAFTLKSFVAVGALSGLMLFMPDWVRFESLNPIAGAVMFGLITGAALLALFRHGASLGGVGILALYLQDRTGFRAGYTQLIFDIVLFAVALTLRDPQTVAMSALGAVVLNLVIAINHRRDRYVAG
ncbi:MAG: YitT family protein [Alphaproteobacteria bacterium]|nr:YitT family protein [Alphaproteobacteria bacterium]